jgi:dynein heavy chain
MLAITVKVEQPA